MSANRPLSPHLQVYRLPLTGLVSITHRMTGVFLSMGLVLFVYVLFAIAAGESAYLAMQAFMAYWLFKLVYWGFIYALFFHLVHGIRHLIWDVGKTFERATLDKFAIYELACSASLTLLTFIVS
ncbi:succinate dehydrogenase, cytochrome b556 subunit [Methylomonas sp. EFPC3]|uniref:succinate dehydrogenase, cytochrome b556 subunit n=1 Tax=Methylomonas TaxID=416 RepID=UPI00112BE5D1|nr:MULTISPECIES: succinate dehydrogenase, cytochrome b556 subunit [Methylomonas]TPQ24872.1 succinate dehydrogenase, cytochrome b556 subunit [Methylomonas koyamae]WFP51611.1 succinate dehydrogenase, cytochrome b556 subunit [Methylomonas sp. EFPC3]